MATYGGLQYLLEREEDPNKALDLVLEIIPFVVTEHDLRFGIVIYERLRAMKIAALKNEPRFGIELRNRIDQVTETLLLEVFGFSQKEIP